MTWFSRSLLALAALLLAGLSTNGAAEEKVTKGEKLKVTLRYRVAGKDPEKYEVVTAGYYWMPSQTAVIVCDMWDTHHCLNAVRRVDELGPRMNQVLEKARNQGVFIIHAPSSCMEPYKDHPGRKLAQD